MLPLLPPATDAFPGVAPPPETSFLPSADGKIQMRLLPPPYDASHGGLRPPEPTLLSCADGDFLVFSDGACGAVCDLFVFLPSA